MASRTHQLLMDITLLLVTFFWGTTFTIVKAAVSQTDVFTFLFVRFALAFFLMAAIFPKRIWPLHGPTIRAGIFLGIQLFSAFALQTRGLTITTATNGALITGLNVVMVPIFSLLLLKKAPAPFAALGVILASTGLYVLTGGAPSQWNRGDLLVFVCAVWIAFHILSTGYYAPHRDTMALATWQLGAVSVLSMGFSLATGTLTLNLPASVWGAVGVTAIFCTVFAFAAQTHAQRFTPPTRTALIFTAEPVFGALFAHLYGGEPMLRQHMTGGGLIFLGMILAEIRPGSWMKIGAGSKNVTSSSNPQ